MASKQKPRVEFDLQGASNALQVDPRFVPILGPMISLTSYRSLAALTLLFVLCGFRVGADVVYMDYSYTIESGSRLSIEGTSNINSFECFCKDNIPPKTTKIQVVNATAIKFQNASLSLRTRALDCDNNKMNSDLCDALKADDYPNIIIQFHDALIVRGTLDDEVAGADLRMQASMIITDITKKVTLDVQAKKVGPGRYRFVCAKKLKMTDFNIDPPTALFGLIRVRDEITVNIDITARIAD